MFHVRHTRLRTPQTSVILNPWSLGCASVPLQLSLNYFLHEIPEKRQHALTISFWNDKPTHNEFFIATRLTLIKIVEINHQQSKYS